MWTKYDYLCTNCDALVEITASFYPPKIDPDCICGLGALINIGVSDGNAPVITNVSNITPTGLVKINTNSYN